MLRDTLTLGLGRDVDSRRLAVFCMKLSHFALLARLISLHPSWPATSPHAKGAGGVRGVRLADPGSKPACLPRLLSDPTPTPLRPVQTMIKVLGAWGYCQTYSAPC